MTTVRAIQRSEGFFKLSNEDYQRPRLSMELMGMLAYFSSLPAGWKINVPHLMATFDVGRDKTRAMLNELESLGHLEHSPDKDSKGQLIKRHHTLKHVFTPLDNDGEPRPYTMVSNHVVQTTAISFKAKGLLTHLLSFPDCWELSLHAIPKICAITLEAAEKLIKELIAAGYLEKLTNIKTKKASYNVHETPINSNNYDKLAIDSPVGCEKPDFQSRENQSRENQSRGIQFRGNQSRENQSRENQGRGFQNPLKIINTNKEGLEKERFKEKAAAKVFNTDLTNSTSQFKKPAAAFLSQLPALQTDDLIIADTLTTNQISMVKARISALTVSYYAPDRLLDEVIITLLQPKSFSNAGTDFTKKLNTIIKTINDQRWTPPSAPKVHQVEAGQQAPSHDHTLQSLYVQRSCLISTVNAFTDQMHFHRTRNNLTIANGMQSQVDDAKAQLVILNAKIVEFESVPPIAAVN